MKFLCLLLIVLCLALGAWNTYLIFTGSIWWLSALAAVMCFGAAGMNVQTYRNLSGFGY